MGMSHKCPSSSQMHSHGFMKEKSVPLCCSALKFNMPRFPAMSSKQISSVERLCKSSCGTVTTGLLFTHFWKCFSNPWTVASCTSSQRLTGHGQAYENVGGNNSYSDSAGLPNQHDIDNSLPGVQNRGRIEVGINRRAAVSEMQVNHLIQQETGFDRLRVMYALGPDWMFLQEDARTITTIFYRSVVLGFFLNAMKAAQSEDKKSKHSSASQAVRKMGMSSFEDSTRVLREAVKGTARLTAFAASLLYLSQSIAAYRNESSVWEYAISASVAMAVTGLGKSPLTLATSAAGGAVAGIIGGMLICSMMSGAGATQEQRTLNRIRKHLELEEKLQQKEELTLVTDRLMD